MLMDGLPSVQTSADRLRKAYLAATPRSYLFHDRSTVWHYTRMTKTIRALDRALHIIQTVAMSESSSLAELNEKTGIPKPTLLRLISTLIQRGYLRQSVIDGRYRASISLPETEAQSVSQELVLLADKAMPHALALTDKIGWPSDIHMRADHFMSLVDTTRSVSPFMVSQKEKNQRLSLYGSATGLACLAWMPRDRVQRLFWDTKPDMLWRPQRFNLSWSRLVEVMEATTARGYAQRLTQHTGETPIDDGMHAIALPLFRKNVPIGAMNVLWPISYKNEAAFAAEYLSVVKDTADKINAALAA